MLPTGVIVVLVFVGIAAVSYLVWIGYKKKWLGVWWFEPFVSCGNSMSRWAKRFRRDFVASWDLDSDPRTYMSALLGVDAALVAPAVCVVIVAPEVRGASAMPIDESFLVWKLAAFLAIFSAVTLLRLFLKKRSVNLSRAETCWERSVLVVSVGFTLVSLILTAAGLVIWSAHKSKPWELIGLGIMALPCIRLWVVCPSSASVQNFHPSAANASDEEQGRGLPLATLNSSGRAFASSGGLRGRRLSSAPTGADVRTG